MRRPWPAPGTVLRAKFKRLASDLVARGPISPARISRLVDAAFGPVFRQIDALDSVTSDRIARRLPRSRSTGGKRSRHARASRTPCPPTMSSAISTAAAQAQRRSAQGPPETRQVNSMKPPSAAISMSAWSAPIRSPVCPPTSRRPEQGDTPGGRRGKQHGCQIAGEPGAGRAEDHRQDQGKDRPP